jgi:dethiobiotin synthetase
MTRGIFITATGTDVGKTYVSALIVKKMKELGYNCGYYKPALSGADAPVLNDCEYVLKKSGSDIKNAKNFVSYLFQPAVSPHLAAKMENNPIKLSKIKNDFARIKSDYDYVLVEGAGGIVCPFNIEENLLLPDVIKGLGLDILIVASAELGTINSTVLTVEYAKNHGINVRGIILNNYNENDFMQKDNKEQVENLTGIKVIATVKKNDDEIEDISSVFMEI